ncbi:AbrB/MazE/SpoVT family DNA-binding domain-containing protein [Microvirga sp. SRT01]|uniref:AbrB/MazE/SpoVT family DNA-binding domain-containing protein n=1 Tax=Sphingomonas longa TaxID=2778730 RepID=A0ABS2D825_9SPHN|nr:AbrB/MazE/SpoVT family DNA-binding domain-containing protein [Microvirga sp. SRT01]MBM6576678.1 AbrB/MazE/SpoVT family DNA-binding domain-containing protein [Sphingomonas sp. BT552]MBR7709723.1 AbrB/MazE/SpoVT family DNA-binding domain-containing protein [Microvirga sp. SRT01]
MTYQARVTAEGQLVLPDELAEELGLRPGTVLTIAREDGKVVLKNYEQVVRDVQARFRAMLPSGDQTSIADELIADRRAEAARENADDDRWSKDRPGA